MSGGFRGLGERERGEGRRHRGEVWFFFWEREGVLFCFCFLVERRGGGVVFFFGGGGCFFFVFFLGGEGEEVWGGFSTGFGVVFKGGVSKGFFKEKVCFLNVFIFYFFEKGVFQMFFLKKKSVFFNWCFSNGVFQMVFLNFFMTFP